MKERALAYPYPPFGHHPNVKGASKAGTRLLDALTEKAYLKPGVTVLSYPDYVLRTVRKGLLEAGIRVVVPAKYGKGYRLLDPVKVKPSKASTIAGAEKVGEKLTTLPSVRLVFTACVAVSRAGDFLTKGYGFSPPSEARELPFFSVVHPLQVYETLPETEGKLHAYATPDEVRWLK